MPATIKPFDLSELDAVATLAEEIETISTK